jgi:23S rRNA U2552 (ribose-2'-O)-methylase RlmE/FtsJ
MLYFLLPHNYSHIYKYITCSEINDTIQQPLSLFNYLIDIKDKINKNEKDWDNYKKYTNPFEFIHTHIPNIKKCISKLRPLSRSFFKMIEIFNGFHFPLPSTEIKTFHLAEGPGGFIEALVYLRHNTKDKYYGMTLQDPDVNVPGWKKSQFFLQQNPNVIIDNGITKTGNIISIENFEYCYTTYGNSMDFITADGGFDFTDDFNNQEDQMLKLLFAQISFALCMQKKGGHFVLKVFDIFLNPTVELLYLLSSFYEKVYITKPDTSRKANSEKYIVCLNYLPHSFDMFYLQFYNVFTKMLNTNKISHFLTQKISNYFSTKIEEYNCCFVQQQIENIHNTLLLINCGGSEKSGGAVEKNAKIQELVKVNIIKCEQWCLKNNIPFHRK